MVFGTNALVTKPAISLAPMIVTAILSHYGYQQISNASASTTSTLSADNMAELHHVMFIMACVVPMVMGSLQLLIWSLYTIRDSHTTVGKYVET